MPDARWQVDCHRTCNSQHFEGKTHFLLNTLYHQKPCTFFSAFFIWYLFCYLKHLNNYSLPQIWPYFLLPYTLALYYAYESLFDFSFIEALFPFFVSIWRILNILRLSAVFEHTLQICTYLCVYSWMFVCVYIVLSLSLRRIMYSKIQYLPGLDT